MARRTLARLLLVLLPVAVGLIVWRYAAGPPTPDGFLVIKDVHGLESARFQLDAPTRVRVEAVGSVGADDSLQAYGWLLDAETRRVVWRLDAGRSGRSRETLVHESDTLALSAGRYEAYFTSYGRQPERDEPFSRAFRPSERWRNDRGDWYLALSRLDGATVPVTFGDADDTDAPGADSLLWRPRDPGTTLLDVPRGAVLDVQATAYGLGSRATVAVERLPGNVRVWTPPPATIRPAGGAPENRTTAARLDLAPGLYRFVFERDDDGRRVNPPYDPRARGVAVRLVSGAARTFDPWADRTPFAVIDRVTGDAERAVHFETTAPLDVFVSATGELMNDAAYDYAWITRDSSNERVWEMSYRESESAGGADKNRLATAFLRLPPGRYAVHYKSDGTHHYDSFNDAAPDHPERWGVALFAVDPAARVAVTRSENENPAATSPVADDAEVTPPPSSEGALASILRVGNNERHRERFRLDEDARVRVYATGEFSGDDAYDYAWIEDEDGDEVWRMTRENTRTAGGSEAFRVFDGTVELPAGRYSLRYTSDGSNAYNDFDSVAPKYPESWGVSVRRAE